MAQKKQNLSNITLLLYALPAIPLALILLPMQVLIPQHYADHTGMGMAAVGLALLLARITDVFTDPLIGIASDRTPKKFSKRKIYVLAAVPLLIISSYFLFNPSEDAGFFYLMGWSALAFIAWTLAILPLETLGAEMSKDYSERAKPTHWREGFVLIGTIITLSIIAFSDNTFNILTYAMIGLVLVCFGAFCFFREDFIEEPKNKEKMSFKKGLSILRNNAHFIVLIRSFLFNTTANALPALLFFMFCEKVIGLDQMQSGQLLFLYFASGLIAMPAWLWLCQRYDKKRIWTVSMLWASVIFLLVPLVGEGDYIFFLVICLLTGVSLGADLAIPAAMQADVIDKDRLDTGKERAGLFFALWSMVQKFSIGIAVGLSYPILEWLDFSTDTVWPVYLFYAGIPILLKLIAIYLMQPYSLDEDSVSELQKEIQNKNSA